MSEKSLIHSFVAKGTVVLAEYTSFSGNFSTIAVQCLHNLPSNSNSNSNSNSISNTTKCTFSYGAYTFNFLLHAGFVYLAVADESVGRNMPFVFLERVIDDFRQRYALSILEENTHTLGEDEEEDGDHDDDYLFLDRFSVAYTLDREFGPRIKEHMQYCMNHPEEMSKLCRVKAQIAEVKGVMIDNIEKVLDRGERIEILVDKAENLHFQAGNFHQKGRQLRRKLWLQNLQMKLMIGGGTLALIIILWFIVCGGFKC